MMKGERQMRIADKLVIFATVILFFSFLSTGCQTSAGGSGESAVNSNPVSDSSSGAKQLYQKLLAEHGADYEECLQEVKAAKAPNQPQKEGVKPKSEQLNVVVALDSSGSMKANISGGNKMDVAKRAVTGFIENLPPNASAALVVYGHKGNNEQSGKSESCAGVEDVYQLASVDKNRLRESVNSFQATGWTPLAAAIERSGQTFADRKGEGNRNIVYVVSDGIETCGGDPVAAARTLHNSDVKAIVNIIGFDVGNEDQQRLREVATAGGGEFIAANSGAELERIVAESRNRIEQTVYETRNRLAQTVTETNYNLARTKFETCVNLNLTKEETRINLALLNIKPDDLQAKDVDGVRQLMREKAERIRAFREKNSELLNSERDVNVEDLQRQLEEVNKQYEGE